MELKSFKKRIERIKLGIILLSAIGFLLGAILTFAFKNAEALFNSALCAFVCFVFVLPLLNYLISIIEELINTAERVELCEKKIANMGSKVCFTENEYIIKKAENEGVKYTNTENNEARRTIERKAKMYANMLQAEKGRSEGEKFIKIHGQLHADDTTGFKCPYCEEVQGACHLRCRKCKTGIKYTISGIK